jgi:hypothetical protein
VFEKMVEEARYGFGRACRLLRKAKRRLESYGGNTRKRRRINHEKQLY